MHEVGALATCVQMTCTHLAATTPYQSLHSTYRMSPRPTVFVAKWTASTVLHQIM